MPEGGRVVVTNTTPLIALAVATGSLDILRSLYQRVLVFAAAAVRGYHSALNQRTGPIWEH